MNRQRAPLAIAVFLALLPAGANAANCGVFAAAINFGNYDVLNPAPTDSTTNVLIICVRDPPPATETVSYTLTLSVGTGSYAARTMTSGGGNTINYNLYTSPAMNAATIWGNGTGGTSVVSDSLAPLTAANQIRFASHTIYGRIPAQQDVAVGTYTGSVVLTMNF